MSPCQKQPWQCTAITSLSQLPNQILQIVLGIEEKPVHT